MGAVSAAEATPAGDVDIELDEPEAPEAVDKVESIGKYQLAFQLASGGMATVYLARADGPAGFEKLVALKRIHPHLAKERAYVEMFLDEARIASRITHANVCSVFDFGEVEGEYFIAMEYLVGEPLSQVLRRLHKQREMIRRPQYMLLVARVMSEACEGLHAAHELRDPRGEPLGVVHRDVSPQNLFVTFDGTCRVVDFGIARARDKIHQTATGELKGKFSYMSPEQIREGREVDRRTDVWALGVMIWEMLTFQRLFRRSSQSKTMYAVLEGEVKPPSAVRNGIPEALDTIVLKALSRDPAERYPTARALGQDLAAFLASAGEAFGAAEVAEWMGELFEGGEARSRQLMDVARMPRDPVPALPPAPATPDDLSPVSSVRTVTPGNTGAAKLPMRRGGLWATLVALGLGAAGAGLYVATAEPSTPPGDAQARETVGSESAQPETPETETAQPETAPAETAGSALTDPQTALAAPPVTEPVEDPTTEPANDDEATESAPPQAEAEGPDEAAQAAARARARQRARRQAASRAETSSQTDTAATTTRSTPPARGNSSAPTDVHGVPIVHDTPF
ncbi:MAG: serine/threonine protein kinase [Sandaracinaceae bacterium]